jgi:hypothetical protein
MASDHHSECSYQSGELVLCRFDVNAVHPCKISGETEKTHRNIAGYIPVFFNNVETDLFNTDVCGSSVNAFQIYCFSRRKKYFVLGTVRIDYFRSRSMGLLRSE